MGANTRQVAGGHYVKYGKFQVWDSWWHWDMDPFQANIVKYVMRVKGDVAKRLEDLDKAEHYLQKYKELLNERLDKMEEQFNDADKESWHLSVLQNAIVRSVAFTHLERQMSALVDAEGLIAAYREQLLKEQEQQNDETQAQ